MTYDNDSNESCREEYSRNRRSDDHRDKYRDELRFGKNNCSIIIYAEKVIINCDDGKSCR